VRHESRTNQCALTASLSSSTQVVPELVNLLMIAVDSGADRMVFAGPVLSHYELEVIGEPRRLNDEEWKQILRGRFPPDVFASRIEGLAPPVWTQSYLVPRSPP